MIIDHRKLHDRPGTIGDPPTIQFLRKVSMTNDGSSTSNPYLVWGDADASGGNPVASITVASGKAGAIIDTISDLTQTTGTGRWNSNGACTLADHDTVQVAAITDGDGNMEVDQFILEVYAVGTTKIAVDQPQWDFCVGDTQLIRGQWLDNNIDRIEITVDGGSPIIANHSGFQGGEWTYTFATQLGPGEYTIIATIYDQDATPNTDSVQFLITVCNQGGINPPTVSFSSAWIQDLPIGTPSTVQGICEAPDASISAPATLAMTVFNAVSQVFESLVGSFSGVDLTDPAQQSWSFQTTNIHLVNDDQVARVTIMQGGNIGTDDTTIDLDNLDPLQKLADHPITDPTPFIFEIGGVPTTPTWEPYPTQSCANSSDGMPSPMRLTISGVTASTVIEPPATLIQPDPDAPLAFNKSHILDSQVSCIASGSTVMESSVGPLEVFITLEAFADATTPVSAPILVQEFVNTTYDSSYDRAADIVVASGGDLQAAFNSSTPGDIIELEAGATWSGTYTFPEKTTGNDWIYVRSSAYQSLPSPGVRVGPSDAANMATISSNAINVPTLQTSLRAHNVRFVGIEFTHGDFNTNQIVICGPNFPNYPDALADQARNITFDRCYVHGRSNRASFIGIAIDGEHIGIVDSYISDIHHTSGDSQAVWTFNGAGPFRIHNSYLEAAGENFMTGGTDPKIAGLIPSDFEITDNHFFKPLAWQSSGTWAVKNLFEIKNGQRLLVENNTFENCWQDAQNGTAMQFTPRNANDTAPQSTCQDVMMRSNTIINVRAWLNIASTDSNRVSDTTKRCTFENNLVYGMSYFAITMGGVQGTEMEGIHFRNNTIHTTDSILLLFDSGGTGAQFIVDDFKFIDNIAAQGSAFHLPQGTPSDWVRDWADSDMINNVFAGSHTNIPDAGNFENIGINNIGFTDYPNGDYRLVSSSPYNDAATDGSDIGWDDLSGGSSGGNIRYRLTFGTTGVASDPNHVIETDAIGNLLNLPDLREERTFTPADYTILTDASDQFYWPVFTNMTFTIARHNAPTGYGAGVFLPAAPSALTVSLVATTTDGTADKEYQGNFQISIPDGETIRVQSIHNSILQDSQDIDGPTSFSAEDDTNVVLPPVTLLDGDEWNIAMSTISGSTDVEKGYWTFSHIAVTDTTVPQAGIFVDSTPGIGDDNNPGTFSEPKATIQAGINAAMDGDTIWIARGTTYEEQVLVSLRKNLTLSGTGYGTGAKPIIDGASGLPLTSATVPQTVGLLEVRNCQGITLHELEVINSDDAGITIRDDQGEPGDIPSFDITISSCDSRNARGWGIIVTGQRHDAERPMGSLISQGSLTNVHVFGCEVENACSATQGGGTNFFGGESITFRYVNGGSIHDNEIFNHNKEGIVCNDGCDGIDVYNNRVRDRNQGSSYAANQGAAIYFDGSTDGLQNCRCWGNYVTGELGGEATGIVVASEQQGDVTNVDVFNNLVVGCQTNQIGLHGDGGSTGPPGTFTNVRVFHNTLVANIPSRANQYMISIRPKDTGGSGDFQIHGNIIYRADFDSTNLVNDANGELLAADMTENVMYNGGGAISGEVGTGHVVGDPLFEFKSFGTAWPVTTLFYPGAGSPAIDVVTTQYTTVDMAGQSRAVGNWDAGCFEVQA